jgi:hypothetical protein
MKYLVLAPPVTAVVWVTEDSATRGLIIRLIIQTIRRDRSGSVWTDDPPNVSSPDRSGADQSDAEHQSTDLAVGGSNPSRRAPIVQVGGLGPGGRDDGNEGLAC